MAEQTRTETARPSAPEDEHSTNGRAGRNGSRKPKPRPLLPMDIARRGARQLYELVGQEPEGVVSLERTEDGWCVGIEVVETRRIPDTADILAEYMVDTDDRGRLTGYRRIRRYSRGRVQEDA